ncbi:MAG: hypothetical protein ACI8W7_004057 [Gammaproteobacteria bacterium]
MDDVKQVQSPMANAAAPLRQFTSEKNQVVARYLRSGGESELERFKVLSKNETGVLERIKALSVLDEHAVLIGHSAARRPPRP